MSYQQVADGQNNPEVPINENMAALGQAFVWAHRVAADSGLVVGFCGGTFDSNVVTDSTLACTNSATNYVVVARSTRVISVDTATTNWDDTVNYGRVARVVFAAGVLTSYNDERLSAGGIFDHAADLAADVVIGPASAVDGHLSQFDGTTGKLLKDGIALDTDGTLAANSDTRVATQKATKTAIATAIATLVGTAPGVLDTLGEISDAINDDANLYTTIVNALALKAPLASPTFTGNPAAPTQSAGDNSTKLATTAYTDAAVAAVAGGGTETTTTMGALIHGASSSATPVDADELAITDSAASYIMKRLTWANLKATLKTYLDTLYTDKAATQTAKTFYGGPTSGSAAAPAFRVLAAADLPAAQEIVTLGTSGTVSVDMTGHSSNAIYRTTLTGNITLNFTGGADGQKALLEITQDSTPRTVTLGTGIAYGVDIASYTPTAVASKTDYLGIAVAGSAYRLIAVTKGY